LRFLAQDSAVYGMAAAISRFATLVTFPIIVRHLTVSDYGVFDILQVFGSFLTVLLIFGQDSGVARYFFDHDDLETRRELISQSLLIRVVVLAVALPLVWLLASGALGLLGIDPSFRPAFGILLLQAPCLVFLNFAVVLLRVTFSRNRFIFLSIGFSFTQAACWLVAILVYDASVGGILLSGLLAAAIFAAIGLYFIRGWLKPTLRLNFVVQMLPYSLPYGAISVLRAIVPLMERALVSLLLAADALGLYAAGAKITMLYALFAFAFQSAWEPFALSIGKRPDAAATYNLVLKVFIVLACTLVLLLTAAARPLLVALASEKFVEATVIVFPLVLALAIESISWITEIGLILQRRTSLKLLGYVLGALASVLGIMLLAPAFGIAGVSVAVLIGAVVKAVVVTLLAGRVHDQRWDRASFLLVLPVTVIGGVLISVVAETQGDLAGMGCFAVVITVLFAIAYRAVLTGNERSKLADAVGRLRGRGANSG
jgi:O-antigen/teichoic acid export membrane protein